MKGFFNAPQKEKAKSKSSKKVLDCNTCSLDQSCETPYMSASGRGEKGILIVGEAPGKNEDDKGKPFVGDSGQLLKGALEELGVSMRQDCVITNACICRPKNNRTPTDVEIACCRKKLHDTIEKVKPRVIIALGGAALKALIGDLMKKGKKDVSINKYRGFAIPDRRFRAWICPTFHPSYILRMAGRGKDSFQAKEYPVLMKTWKGDLARAISHKKPPRINSTDEADLVRVLTKESDCKTFLRGLISDPPECISFDYETTGLKPHRKGHKVLCVSIATSPDDSTVFPMYPSLVPLMQKVLKSKHIKKGAHHLKFEDMWSNVILETVVNGWDWCSQIASHVIDNRPGITSLKFQSHVNQGIIGYEDSMADYIKCTGEEEEKYGDNGFNRMEQAPLHEMLVYCGIDSLVQYRLMQQQKEIIFNDEGLLRGYKLLHEGSLALAELERRGIRVNEEYCNKQYRVLSRKIDYVTEQLMEMKVVKHWKKWVESSKKKMEFKLNSGPQLSYILYDYLGLEPTKETKKGKASVDEEALSAIDHPLVYKILELRKLQKMRDTFLGGIMRETVDGLLHPFFHLDKVITYRSSSSSPNFQNLPIRDPEMGKTIRRALIPRPGRMLVEIDYSGIEVRIAATYHKDQNMLAYINDPKSDMHWDMAKELFILTDDQRTKEVRQTAKNAFVFAEFYGDWYESCAINLWNQIEQYNLKTKQGVPIYEHLRQHGIRNLEDYIEHVKGVEENFWNERFPEYRDWKLRHIKQYHKRGYFRLHTGFMCQGVMKKNDALNYGTQGAAFHCLLYSLINITKYCKKNKLQSFPVGQIHDSILLDVVPEELNEIMEVAQKIMCEDIVKEWDWIIVPLEIEADVTPINGTWYDKKAVSKGQCKKCDTQWLWKYEKDGVLYEECPVCEHRTSTPVERKKAA